MNNQIVPTNGSPFDSIRRINVHGEEYWSTRELGPLMGYTRFENFLTPVKRAMTTANNQGYNVEVLFLRSQEKGLGRPAEDFELSRFAAYLVAMNGDPNKAEVAAAQAYFAIQTRVAETAPKPLTLAERSRQVIGELDAMVQQQAAQLERQAPLVAQAELSRSSDGHETIGDVANRLQLWAASNHSDVKVLHKDVWDLAGELGIIIRGNTARNNLPTAQAIKADWVRVKETVVETNHGNKLKTSIRLTPRGSARLWDAAIHRITARAVPVSTQKEYV